MRIQGSILRLCSSISGTQNIKSEIPQQCEQLRVGAAQGKKYDVLMQGGHLWRPFDDHNKGDPFVWYSLIQALWHLVQNMLLPISLPVNQKDYLPKTSHKIGHNDLESRSERKKQISKA